MIVNCTLCGGAGFITPPFSTSSAKCPRCNGISFNEIDEKDIGFDPKQARYICFDVREEAYFVQGPGDKILARGSGDQYREFRSKCLVRGDLFSNCVDYNVDEKGRTLRRRHWADFGATFPKPAPVSASVSASATPAAPLERENLWTAVQAGLYDHPRDTSVAVADRVTSALENSKPAVLCVGNVLYYREDKALKEAKELRERAATLISSLRSVVDECEQRLRPKGKVPFPEQIHAGCGGVVIPEADFVSGEGDELWWNYRCTKCGDTFKTVKEFKAEPAPKRKPAVKKAVVNKRKKAVKK